MKKLIYLFVIAMLLSGCETIDYAALQQQRQANINSYSSQVNEWRNQFQKSDYPSRLKMLESYVEKQTNAELSVLNGISQTWDYSIQSGRSFGQDIYGGLAAANAEGWVDIYQMYFDAIQKSMGEINNPSNKYSKVYDSLLECFSIYSQLHSLARSPQGNYVSFNKAVNDLSLEANKNLNKLKVLLQ